MLLCPKKIREQQRKEESSSLSPAFARPLRKTRVLQKLLPLVFFVVVALFDAFVRLSGCGGRLSRVRPRGRVQEETKVVVQIPKGERSYFLRSTTGKSILAASFARRRLSDDDTHTTATTTTTHGSLGGRRRIVVGGRGGHNRDGKDDSKDEEDTTAETDRGSFVVLFVVVVDWIG